MTTTQTLSTETEALLRGEGKPETEREKAFDYLAYDQCKKDIGKRFPIQFLRDLSLSLVNAATDELKKYNVPEEIISAIENCWISSRSYRR